MHAQISQLKGLPVIGLQTGEMVARVSRPIIEVSSLEVLAFRCDAAAGQPGPLLLTSDIRQIAADCLIIDSEDELTLPHDIVRLAPVLKADFSPLDKPVYSDTGRKLGRVEDYSLNLETFRIQKLYLRGPFWQAWLGNGLIIDRTQILDITPRRITVREPLAKAPLLPNEPMPEVNP